MLDNTTNIFKSHEDELLKLFVIFSSAKDGEKFTKEYLQEKIECALMNCPIGLHPSSLYEYERLKAKLKEPVI